ncbi:protein NEN1-like isoform X1 [Wolffia australiana]
MADSSSARSIEECSSTSEEQRNPISASKGSPKSPQNSSPELVSISDSSIPIVFFDVETSVPSRAGQGYALLEFGAILVCPQRLVELGSYSTLIRPQDVSVISPASLRCNGITQESVASAPEFGQVAGRIHEILHGRIWAGHNILRFDCLRIREAFDLIGHPAPEPAGTIDSLRLLTQRFGKRAGNMKMATLANYFGLGKQKHRSLDDVRMNLEVLKSCATVLFLESSLMESNLPVKSPLTVSSKKTVSRIMMNVIASTPSDSPSSREYNSPEIQDSSTLPALVNDLTPLIARMNLDSDSAVIREEPSTSQDSNPNSRFLEPDMVLSSDLRTVTVNSGQNGKKVIIMHKDIALQLFCKGLKVLFGVNTKFKDYAGRPKLSIVVNAPLNVCSLLDLCDDLAQETVLESGSNSEWRAVIKRAGPSGFPTFRLQIPSVENGDVDNYSTEIHQREASGSTRKLVFSKVDVEELQSLFSPGMVIDAYFSLKVYDYQQNSGIRLMAQRLIIHPH